MNKKSKKGVLLALSVLLIAGTLAFFTDTAEFALKGSSKVVELQVENGSDDEKLGGYEIGNGGNKEPGQPGDSGGSTVGGPEYTPGDGRINFGIETASIYPGTYYSDYYKVENPQGIKFTDGTIEFDVERADIGSGTFNTDPLSSRAAVENLINDKDAEGYYGRAFFVKGEGSQSEIIQEFVFTGENESVALNQAVIDELSKVNGKLVLVTFNHMGFASDDSYRQEGNTVVYDTVFTLNSTGGTVTGNVSTDSTGGDN